MDEPCETAKRSNLRDFDAYTDRNGQNFGQDEAREDGRPDSLQHAPLSAAGWPAEAARIASDFPRLDGVEG